MTDTNGSGEIYDWVSTSKMGQYLVRQTPYSKANTNMNSLLLYYRDTQLFPWT